MPTVPTIDLAVWRTGSAAEREAIAAEVDSALQRVGFLLVAGHGVPDVLRDDVRAAARSFFDSLAGGQGGVRRARPAGAAGSRVAPRPTPLSEGTRLRRTSRSRTRSVPTTRSATPLSTRSGSRPTCIRPSSPGCDLRSRRTPPSCRTWRTSCSRCSAAALGLAEDTFTAHTKHPTWTFQVNWYPSMDVVGDPLPGQFRIGPHTDFGSVTILDRQPGRGGLAGLLRRGRLGGCTVRLRRP